MESLKLGESTLKTFSKKIDPSKTISLSVARPAPQYSPWDSLLIRGGQSQPHETCTADASSDMYCTRSQGPYNLDVAMGYGTAAGNPQLLQFISDHVELIHRPLYSDWQSCLTCGTTSALDIVLRLFCNRGDWIIADTYTYPGFIERARAQGLNILAIDMDDQGLMPNDLDSKLKSWNTINGVKPFLLYTIPSGHNPTGVTQSSERRKAIYGVAEQHDVYIVEDDPYFYLHLGKDSLQEVSEGMAEATQTDYTKRLPVSYLSLDRTGRVLRLDSCSKILAPGLRCGWMTACAQVVEKFLTLTDLSTTAPSGPSQLLLYKLLTETWGHEGFFGWLNGLSLEYCRRRDALVAACRKHLPSEVCSWSVPAQGMFLWICVDSSHVLEGSRRNSDQAQDERNKDFEDRVYSRAQANGVLVSKGSWFLVGGDKVSVSYFCMTFVAAPESLLEQAVKRFGNALRAESALGQD